MLRSLLLLGAVLLPGAVADLGDLYKEGFCATLRECFAVDPTGYVSTQFEAALVEAELMRTECAQAHTATARFHTKHTAPAQRYPDSTSANLS
jgi:hypothetical protein